MKYKLEGQKSTAFSDEIINEIFETYEAVKNELKDNPLTKEEPLSDEKIMNTALFRLGITDTVNIPDRRTYDILNDYEFHKYAPHLIDNAVWKESVILINRLQPRLF